MWATAVGLSAGLLGMGCAEESTSEEAAPPGDQAAEDGAGETSDSPELQLIAAVDLGSGWTENPTDTPTASIFGGSCGGPDLVSGGDVRDYARFERGGVAMQYVLDVEDPQRLADEMATAIDGCQGEEDGDGAFATRVRTAQPISLSVDGMPATDAYRLVLESDLGDIEHAWAATATDQGLLSLIGATTSDLQDNGEDVLEVLEDAVAAAFGLDE